MRLLYGSVSCDGCDWLALGDAPGAPEKLFQFGAEAVMPVRVKGQRLRASNKPLEGRLLVESNGGTATVVLRAEVPVRPFADGVLAGATTPRQVAEKAKAAPKEAAALFEAGAVARWYEANGWTYPVQGPAASGLGAVQQFFEALGLTPPPRVDISERAVTLSGTVGARIRHVLEVKSEERRPVYAHAVSNQPWLAVGRAKLKGRVASIPLVVSVPDREGETLAARVVVQSNGNQRFVVPVTLEVGGSFNFDPAPPAASVERLVPAATRDEEPATKKERPRAGRAVRPPSPGPRPLPRRAVLHLLPAFALLCALAGVLACDVLSPPRAAEGIDAALRRRWPDLIDTQPRLDIHFDPHQRFGLSVSGERDPADPQRHKRLTFDEKGGTNNTCIRIDEYEYRFGDPLTQGQWVMGKRPVQKPDGYAWESAFEFLQKVQLTQTVELVPGSQTRVLDTCLVRYAVENRSDKPHKVGLRILLDTFIGANDGVPFAVPGRRGLLEGMEWFGPKDLPDYVQATERPDPKDPGTVAHLGLKLPDVEPIDRMLIAAWPGSGVRWDWPPEPMNKDPLKKDSSVALYWAEVSMNPGERRQMAFTYGLNAIASESGDAPLGLTAGGDFRPGREFTVTAYVKHPHPGQVVRLSLPAGLGFAAGSEPEQKVEGGGDYTQVSWRVRAAAAGDYALDATSGTARATYPVKVRAASIY
jgi:hypothetical protein